MSAYANSVLSREVVKGENTVPVKLYNFKSVLNVFPSTIEVKRDLLEMMNVLRHPSLSPDRFTYAITMAWGYKQKDCRQTEIPVKAFDIFRFKFDKPWKECNPEIDVCCLKNMSADEQPAICETGTIIIGKEGELRRKTNNLAEYMGKWPDLGELLCAQPVESRV